MILFISVINLIRGKPHLLWMSENLHRHPIYYRLLFIKHRLIYSVFLSFFFDYGLQLKEIQISLFQKIRILRKKKTNIVLVLYTYEHAQPSILGQNA